MAQFALFPNPSTWPLGVQWAPPPGERSQLNNLHANYTGAWLVASVLAWLPVVGCGGQSVLDMATTPAEARETITTALDAWQKGTSQKDLAQCNPPLYLQDPLYARGSTLQEYKLENEGKVVGTGISYIVTMKLKGDAGKDDKNRRIAYRVVTRPNKAVTLEEGIP